jgi:hypothetical protein
MISKPSHASSVGGDSSYRSFNGGEYTASTNQKIEGTAATISYYNIPYTTTGTFSSAWIAIQSSALTEDRFAQVGWLVDKSLFPDGNARYFYANVNDGFDTYQEQYLSSNVIPTKGSSTGYKIMCVKTATGYQTDGYINGTKYFSATSNWYPGKSLFLTEINDTSAQNPGIVASHERFSNASIYSKYSTSTSFSWIYPSSLDWITGDYNDINMSAFMGSHYFDVWDTRY